MYNSVTQLALKDFVDRVSWLRDKFGGEFKLPKEDDDQSVERSNNQPHPLPSKRPHEVSTKWQKNGIGAENDDEQLRLALKRLRRDQSPPEQLVPDPSYCKDD